MYDIAIVGGGILGGCTALNLAQSGMRVALLEKGGLCMQASGRNAGTLTLLYARDALLALTLKGKEMWENSRSWLGADVGHRFAPGVEVAFTRAEAELLEADMNRRRDAGVPIEVVGGNRAREIEPGLSEKVVLAGYSPYDGWAAPNLVGGLLREALLKAGVHVMDGVAVTGIEPHGTGFTIRREAAPVEAKRILITANVWAKQMLGWLGIDGLPIQGRVNQVIVTERMEKAISAVVRVVSQISLKQTDNGTFLIGSGAGFPWVDDPDDLAGDLNASYIMEKLGVAAHAIPALRHTRMMRTWHGYEGYTPDNQPLVGPVPGVPNAYVMACMRSGWTVGPYVGKLMAQTLLEQQPDYELFRPEFDMRRFTSPPAEAAG